MFVAVVLTICFPAVSGAKDCASSQDIALHIAIERDVDDSAHVRITLENRIYKAVIRPRHRKIKSYGEVDHGIRDWILKSRQQDQVDVCVDGSALRPACTAARIVHDHADAKTVRLSYGDSLFLNDYTIYRDSPVIRIDYLEYGSAQSISSWMNAVDIATPGGLSERFTATTHVLGQEQWIRPLTYHESAYWSIHASEKKIYHTIDDSSAGSLNYKDHFVMVVLNPETGIGFGRVMPIYKEGMRGGVRILKLLWDVGFEPFIATGQSYRPPVTGYIFLFDQGVKQALELGKAIVDGTFRPSAGLGH